MTGFAGEFRLSGSFDLARSLGDSLGGRNLFPGGGSFSMRGDASGLVGAGATLANVSAFYFKPLGLSRPVQANRLIPTGDFVGANVGLLLPLGGVLVSPALSFTRESSSADNLFGATLLVLQGSGWAVSGSLGVDIPLGRSVSIMPEAGYVGGRVRGDLFLGALRINPLSSFSDAISGWWTALELSASF